MGKSPGVYQIFNMVSLIYQKLCRSLGMTSESSFTPSLWMQNEPITCTPKQLSYSFLREGNMPLVGRSNYKISSPEVPSIRRLGCIYLFLHKPTGLGPAHNNPQEKSYRKKQTRDSRSERQCSTFSGHCDPSPCSIHQRCHCSGSQVLI